MFGDWIQPDPVTFTDEPITTFHTRIVGWAKDVAGPLTEFAQTLVDMPDGTVGEFSGAQVVSSAAGGSDRRSGLTRSREFGNTIQASQTQFVDLPGMVVYPEEWPPDAIGFEFESDGGTFASGGYTAVVQYQAGGYGDANYPTEKAIATRVHDVAAVTSPSKWVAGQVIARPPLSGYPELAESPKVVLGEEPGGLSWTFEVETASAFVALMPMYVTDVPVIATGSPNTDPDSFYEGTSSVQVLSASVTGDFLPPRYRFIFPDPNPGAWPLRQKQLRTAAQGLPLRQRQAGANQGGWPLRQRQQGV